MRRFTSIVATNNDGAIGAGNTLPWRIKSDMKFFKETTQKNVVVMGRKTFDSLGQKCLPDRRNVILTHSLNLLSHKSKECQSVNSIQEALFQANSAPKRCKEVFIIGGSSMYEQFAPYVERYLITIIDKKVPDADAFFDIHPLQSQGDWEMKPIAEGYANSDGDEADYKIFELTNLNPDAITQRRDEAVEIFAKKIEAAKTKHEGEVGHQQIINDNPTLSFA